MSKSTLPSNVKAKNQSGELPSYQDDGTPGMFRTRWRSYRNHAAYRPCL